MVFWIVIFAVIFWVAVKDERKKKVAHDKALTSVAEKGMLK